MGKQPEKTEQHNDAWLRFERAVDVVAKSSPQHRTKREKSPVKKLKKQNAHK